MVVSQSARQDSLLISTVLIVIEHRIIVERAEAVGTTGTARISTCVPPYCRPIVVHAESVIQSSCLVQ